MPQLLYCKKCGSLYVIGDKCSCRKSKYNAIPTMVDGHRFDSQHEANRYCELKMLEQAGQIRNLEMQVSYTITSGRKPRKYIADFRYIDASGKTIVEDAKSCATKTQLYRLKKELVKQIYGIEIREV